MKRVLITGINGFIGNAAKEYFDRKYDVYGIDIVGEANDKQFIVDMKTGDLRELLQRIQPDVIIHAAGGANVSKSVEFPKTDFENCVEVFYNLLDSIRISKIKTKVIFLSSAAVYGNAKQLPISEDTELNPISPYGLHKRMCEEIGEYYKCHYGMDICVLRIFSVYGPGLKKQIMWDMFQKFMGNGKIELFGTGDESRDFIYIDDFLRSIEIVMNTETEHTIYNIANGEAVTIREVAETFSQAMCGENRESFNNEVREGDPRFWKADITRIKALGYQPEIELKDGIERYIEWAKAQMCEA